MSDPCPTCGRDGYTCPHDWRPWYAGTERCYLCLRTRYVILPTRMEPVYPLNETKATP